MSSVFLALSETYGKAIGGIRWLAGRSSLFAIFAVEDV
jgi:hypothetical protein